MTSAVRKPTPPLTETGYAQAPAHNWWQYQDETTPELMWPQSISVYDAMRRTDSQVKSVLQAMTLPVRSTPWRVDPDGATDEVSEFVADNLGLPVVGMEPKSPLRQQDRFSWDDHIRLALLMLPFGHMFFEQIYRVDPDGKARIRKMGPRMPKTIEKIDVAEDGGLISITQYWTRTDRRPQPIPVNRLVAYVNEREGGNWLGNSILRPAYKNWLLKDRLLRVWAQTIERNGMGIPLYKGPEDATDLSTGLAMAKAWRAGEAAGSAVPFGADLTLVGVSGTLPDADPAVRYHDEQIGRAVLAHFLNLGTQTGSWALGTTFADFFTLSLQSLAMQIADTTTRHVVEDLVDINFGPDEPAPRVVFDEIGSRQPATAQSLVALFGAGALTPDARLEESLRQQYGLPPRQNEVDTGTDQPLIEEPAEGPIEVTARASYPGQKWRHGWKRIGDALMPKRGPAPSTAGPDSDRPPSMSDLAHELDGLRGGGKRKHLLDLGYDADEVYALLGDDDMPKSMSDLAYELRGLSPGDKVNVLLAWGYLPDEIPDLLGMGRSVRAAGQAILDRIDGRDTVEPGQFDAVEVDAAALVAALADFCGEIWAEADFNPDLHPRGAGGRFRSTFARIQRALTDWGNGDGPDDPLHAFPDREPLRQAAVKRGVKLKRGATRDEIVDALLADARGKRAGTEDVPKPRASFTLKGRDHRDLDVGVYVENKPNSRIFLRRESNGRPGTIEESFDDLDALHAWAQEHGETELAGWARSEQGPNPKAAPRKAAPKKVAAPVATGDLAKARERLRSRVSFLPDWQREKGEQALAALDAGDMDGFDAATSEILANLTERANFRRGEAKWAEEYKYPRDEWRDAVKDVHAAVKERDGAKPAKAAPKVTTLTGDPRAAKTPNGGLNRYYRGLRSSMLHGKSHDLSGLVDEDLKDLRAHIEADPRRDHLYDASIAAVDAELTKRGAPSKAPVKRVPGKKAAPKAESRAPRTSPATGDEALGLTAVPLRSEAERRAFRDWAGGYVPVNYQLRQNGGAIPTGRATAYERRIASGLDSALARSPLAEDIVVTRGVDDLSFLAGPPDVGREWLDHGFNSTAAKRPQGITGILPGGAQMRISVPAGTHAVSGPGLDPDEILLDRGLRYRVTKAEMGSDGVWRIDAEVLPSDAPDATPPAEQAARDRQVKVDRASSVHDLVSEMDQLLTDGASDRALKARITSRAKVSNTPPEVRDRLLAAVGDEPAMRKVLADIRTEEGLTPIGEAGAGARFDPALHESIGADIPLGASVTVVRPGHRLDAEDATFPARVEAGEPPNPDGLDDLTDAQVKSLATEWEVPKGSRTSMLAGLRANGAVSPRVARERAAAAIDSDPTGASGLSRDRAVRGVQIQNRVKAAYVGLTARPGDWVKLSDLRDQVRDLDPDDVDRALFDMSLQSGITVAPEHDKRLLTQRDRSAAVVIGNQDKHIIKIADATPTPLPVAKRPSTAAFVPVGVPPIRLRAGLSSDPEVRRVQIENHIRAAYADLTVAPGQWVKLSTLRDQLGDLDRAEVDRALFNLGVHDRGVSVVPESNQKTLTDRDRAAAVVIDNQDKHLISISDASTRPLPISVPEVPAHPEPSGKTALDATHVPTRALSADEVLSLGGYGLESHHNVNGGLRAGSGSTAAMRPKHQEMVADLDALLARTPTSQDIVVYRGVGGRDLTGNGFPIEGDPHDTSVDWTGRTWTDHGYSSTSATREGAKSRTSRVMLRVSVPAGTPAISGSELDPGEILLGRGLTYRVTADHGVTDGARRLDVEIVPPARPSAPSVPTKATPARKAAKKAAPKVATSDTSTALIDAGDDTSAISSALASLNSSQLKDLARQYGITGGSRMNRAQLVAALTEAVRRRNLASGVGETIAESAAKARGGA